MVYGDEIKELCAKKSGALEWINRTDSEDGEISD